MRCNLACPYCYEEGFRYTTMNKDTELQFVRFIKDSFINKNGLGICWYGGEPLFGLKQIEFITKELWKDEKIKENYQADIVTNGVYLTRKNAELLRDLGVSNAQITLDGPLESITLEECRKMGALLFILF